MRAFLFLLTAWAGFHLAPALAQETPPVANETCQTCHVAMEGHKVNPYHSDCLACHTPEPKHLVDLPIDDIIDFRSTLVRGMHWVKVGDVEDPNRLVVQTRDLALARRPPEVFAEFQRKPKGRLTVDDDVQPFGPSAPLNKFEVSNYRFDSRLEKAYFDSDLKARDAVVSLYRQGSLVSQIQRAFSVGAIGVGQAAVRAHQMEHHCSRLEPGPPHARDHQDVPHDQRVQGL